MAKTLFMMCGLPASGKSTKAREMLKEFGSGNAKRVNKDDLRAMLDDGYWSGGNEKFLLRVRDFIITEALKDGKHVVVDDTNLAPKHRARLSQLAEENGARFEIVDFSHVSPEECVERDRKRPNYVGQDVIWKMYRQFLAPVAVAPESDPALPSIVIVDIDGTVAQMNGRGPYEWEKVGTDRPRPLVMNAARNLGHRVIFVSGRDEGRCRAVTEEWLGLYWGSEFTLFMRPAGDMRRDSIVKRELYEAHIQGKFNVIAIFDDRPRVIRECWQILGFTDRIFNVGDGSEF
jgi:predicted kinase